VYVLFLVVSSSAIDCLETGKTHLRNDQLVLNWTLNRIHSLTDIQHKHSSVWGQCIPASHSCWPSTAYYCVCRTPTMEM